MNRRLENYVKKFENFLEPDVCDLAVEQMNNINFKEHTFYDPITQEYINRSGSNELEVGRGEVPVKEIIMDGIWNAIKRYQDVFEFSWFNSWQGFTEVRFNKYSENKQMALHCDHIQSMFDGERKGIPILSCLGLLNDDYEGGEFIMFDDMKIDFKKGDLLIFPSNFLYPHKVQPVTKGTRYSYISWVW
jgi:hypothetical protein